MYNEVRRQQLTEAELRSVVRNMIIEEIENGQLDEGIFNFFKAAKNTAAPDVQRAGKMAQDAGTAMRNGYNNAVGKVRDAYNNTKEKVNTFGRNAGEQVKTRTNAMKQMYNSYQAIDKINSLQKQIQSMSNLFTDANTQAAANAFIQRLDYLKGGLGHGGTQTQQQKNIRNTKWGDKAI